MFSCLFSSWISCSPSCVKWPCKFTQNLPAMKISSWCLLFQLVPYAVQLNKLTMEPKCWSSECRLLQVLCVVRVTFAAKAEKRTSRHCFCRQGVWSDPLFFLVWFLHRAWTPMHRSALQTFWVIRISLSVNDSAMPRVPYVRQSSDFRSPNCRSALNVQLEFGLLKPSEKKKGVTSQS